MQHSEHVHLIRKAISTSGGVWADFGSGEGAFTLALRDLAGPDITIHSIDKDTKRLETQEMEFKKLFPDTKVTFLQTDFTKSLDLPLLDGILMTNSLHYVKDQHSFLTFIQKYLKPQGKLVLVEYNIDISNHWVPYPLSYQTFATLAQETGFTHIELLEKIPSVYWEEMYSAQATKK